MLRREAHHYEMKREVSLVLENCAPTFRYNASPSLPFFFCRIGWIRISTWKRISIEPINVGRRNNFHLVIISNNETSLENRTRRGNFHPAFQFTTFLRSMTCSFREHLTAFDCRANRPISKKDLFLSATSLESCCDKQYQSVRSLSVVSRW